MVLLSVCLILFVSCPICSGYIQPYVTNSSCSYTQDTQYGGEFADCSKRGLDAVPKSFKADTTSIDLSQNNLQVLKDYSFRELNTVRLLNLAENQISEIEVMAFDGLTKLEELKLQGNNLKLDSSSVPDHVFQPLSNLQRLYLQNNKRGAFTHPTNISFNGLEKLKLLQIDTSFKEIFGTSFRQLRSLNTLILYSNFCYLSIITNNTFEVFNNSVLETLNMARCALHDIETGAFASLHYLNKLILKDVRLLSPKKLLRSLPSLGHKNISLLNFDRIIRPSNENKRNIYERILTDQTVKYLADLCVEEISLRGNFLLFLDLRPLLESRFAHCIKYIGLSNNNFYGTYSAAMHIMKFPFLQYLDLRGATFMHTTLPEQIEHNGDAGSSDLQFVREMVNETIFILRLPETLSYLDMSFTMDGNTVGETNITNGENMRTLNISFNDLSGFKDRFRGLERLTVLDMSGNDCSAMRPDFLITFPSLEKLSLKSSHLGQTAIPYDTRFFRGLSHLMYLDLSHNRLGFLWDDIFSDSDNIQELDLSNNHFRVIPFDLKTTQNIIKLDLSYNSIAYIDLSDRQTLNDLASNQSISFSLAGNVLSCGCERLDFILWLFTSKVVFDQHGNYSCITDDGKLSNTARIYEQFVLNWRRCQGRFWLSFSVSGLAVIFSVLLLVHAIRNRWTKLQHIFLKLLGYEHHAQHLKQKNFAFDAYIGYCDTDLVFVYQNVRRELEQRHKLRLFLRERDSTPGGEIAEDIITGIDSSWKILVLLGPNYFQDQWASFIVRRAVFVAADQPSDRIILVIHGNLNKADIPETLLNTVEEDFIFDLEDYRGNEDVLWTNVRDAIVKA